MHAGFEAAFEQHIPCAHHAKMMPGTRRSGHTPSWSSMAKLDLRVRVRYIDATGVSVDIESERLFVITLIDVCTRIVLGWQLVPAPEYDHHDVLCAIQDALRPRLKRQEFSIPGLAYRPGAGFVSMSCRS
ncbi:MAG: hypothetical protein IPJ48_17280 [Propionivibrio sp.]|uniref:Integrase catalytic domain-containing protein n=1 Tax=Candidatus Propionivibrio dominans TaxID=2954373 RepID=A0A9D7F9J2_9RHOO|nr:hypothetical protein [Candidatus Propionivibrio dominans]